MPLVSELFFKQIIEKVKKKKPHASYIKIELSAPGDASGVRGTSFFTTEPPLPREYFHTIGDKFFTQRKSISNSLISCATINIKRRVL